MLTLPLDARLRASQARRDRSSYGRRPRKQEKHGQNLWHPEGNSEARGPTPSTCLLQAKQGLKSTCGQTMKPTAIS